MVNWTLAIEIKFYLLLALLYVPIRQGRVLPVLVLSIVLFAVNFVLTFLSDSGLNVVTLLLAIAADLVYVQFMLIGVIYYFRHEKIIMNKELTIWTMLQLLLFAITWRYSSLCEQFPVVPKIYAWGLVLFSFAFWRRHSFRSRPTLNRLADISYPLYLLHPLLGYVIIKMLMFWELSFFSAVVFAAIFVFSTAYGFHRFIEVPSNALGKRLAKSWPLTVMAK
jgi:peptidoglycan/LPS O-acetylase OafA/YrhL